MCSVSEQSAMFALERTAQGDLQCLAKAGASDPSSGSCRPTGVVTVRVGRDDVETICIVIVPEPSALLEDEQNILICPVAHSSFFKVIYAGATHA